MAFVYNRFDRGIDIDSKQQAIEAGRGKINVEKSEEVAKNKTDESGELNGNHS